MSLGAGVKIVGPDDVVEQMRREIERLSNQYGVWDKDKESKEDIYIWRSQQS